MVDLVVDLPVDTSACILNSWLNAREVIRLDSAYCNKRYRPLLLQTLTSSFAVQHAVQKVPQHRFCRRVDVTAWMIKRSVKCVNLTCESDCVDVSKSMETVLAFTGSVLQSITFKKEKHVNDCYERNWIPDLSIYLPLHVALLVTKYCPKLRTLNCMSVIHLPIEVNDMVTKCRFLKELNLEGCSDISVSILNACSEAAHLEAIDFTGCTFGGQLERVDGTIPVCRSVRKLSAQRIKLQKNELLTLLKSFPNLTELSVGVGEETIDVAEVAKRCPLMEVCMIMNPIFVDESAAAIICHAWGNIRNLTMYQPVQAPVCTEEALLMLIQQCLTLEYLHINTSPIKRHLTTSCPPNVAHDCTKSRLRNMHIMSVSAASLHTIVALCPYLRFLHIRRLHTWEGYLAQSNAETAENSLHLLHASAVKVVTIEDCELTSVGLANVNNLEEIYLKNFYGDFTADDLISMAQRCSDLHTLAIDDPPNHIDWCLIRGVLDGCPQIYNFEFTNVIAFYF